MPEPNSGCWLWMGAYFSKRGCYGCFTHRPSGTAQERAHRTAWKLYRHDISPEQHVLHRCDNPACVNPDHLFLGDQISNMRDKVRKGRQQHGEASGRAVLSKSAVLKIHADPRKYSEIATEFSISEPTVSDIKRGVSWKHLRLAPNRRNRPAVRAESERAEA